MRELKLLHRGLGLIGGKIAILPCGICGHRDSRDASHARGCPSREPLSKPELLALARQIEAGWKAKLHRP